jgi:hypothetical protein
MSLPRDLHHQSALHALDQAVAAARSGFACLFSGSEDYEQALIAARRAEGRYGPAPSRMPWLVFIGLSLVVAGTALIVA